MDSTDFQIEDGLTQGRVLRPTLLIMAIDHLLGELKDTKLE